MLVLCWILGVWLIGWATLPCARRIFAVLPDGGLAVARVLFLAFASLLAFWLASLHLSPLRFVPLILGTLALASISVLFAPDERRDFLDFVRARRRALLASDAVFLAALLFFGFVRWCNPALNTLEKPMDAALLSAAWRADWLPFQHPWLCATDFTGYYSFGPLMAANLARCFGGAPPLAYNLAQPVFCAFFVSTLFSFCASLCHTAPRALAATFLVALCGNFEPLRQWHNTGHLWPLNWWFTSRVVPDTINEYPLFTLAIGDAHAHFYALALSAAGLCLARALLSPADTFEDPAITAAPWSRFANQSALALVAGLLLAVVAQTNPWDAPIFGLLCGLLALQRRHGRSLLSYLWLAIPFLIARLALWPHLRTFHPAIHGVAKELWIPSAEWLLMWSDLLILSLAAALHLYRNSKHRTGAAPSSRLRVSLVVAVCGVAALLAPHGITVLGVFADTAMRHQDTVFKFGLQAWVLLGSVAACGALEAWARWPQFLRAFALLFPLIPALAAASVLWGQIGEPHASTHSLDGAAFLSSDDRAALAWLTHQGRPGDAVLEAGGDGSYTPYSRIAALSGFPTVLGWPPHVSGWGASPELIMQRQFLIDNVFRAADTGTARAALDQLRPLGVRWIFVGDLERQTYPPESLEILRKICKVSFQSGRTVILQL